MVWEEGCFEAVSSVSNPILVLDLLRPTSVCGGRVPWRAFAWKGARPDSVRLESGLRGPKADPDLCRAPRAALLLTLVLLLDAWMAVNVFL